MEIVLHVLMYVFFVLVLLVSIILLTASRRPDTFRTARTRTISSAPEKLFPLIDNLRQMNSWNPYALRETSGTARYSGPERGEGATFHFAGSKSGSGHIEVIESRPNSTVTLRLAMVKPFKVDNTVEFTLEPKGAATDVTWAMHGKQPLLGKVMALFINCDKMMGRDFEEGLANLAKIAEKS